MQAKPIFLLNTAVGLFFGFSLLLMPEFILNMLDVGVLGVGPSMAQHTGAWVLSAAILTFLVKDEEHSNFRQSVFIFFVLSYALMAIIEIYGYIMQLAGPMLLALVALHAVFAAIFGYLYMENR